jgi:hypothetical protein
LAGSRCRRFPPSPPCVPGHACDADA